MLNFKNYSINHCWMALLYRGGKKFFYWKQGKLLLCDKARNAVTEKNKDVGFWKYVSPNFAKYLIIQKCKKAAKLLMFRSDFRKKGVCSKFITKKLYGNTFLVSESIFKLVCHCESCRWFVVRKGYCGIIFEETVTVAYLKKHLP